MGERIKIPKLPMNNSDIREAHTIMRRAKEAKKAGASPEDLKVLVRKARAAHWVGVWIAGLYPFER